MTVHSSKGLEYKYVYILGCEENLFPSQRALESPDGVEEERRLFYVALTRAKSEAVLSYCEMRFKWGNMEFSSPSRFLKEIDSRYVDCEEDLSERPQWRRESQEEGFTGRMGNFQRGGVSRGGSRGEERRDGRTAIEALRQQFDYRFQKKREEEKRKPDPRLVAPVKPRSTEGMRRVESVPTGSSASVGACAYAVGERVEHPTFGAGEVVRIESLATDYKVVVNFSGSEKTLLAKFAKLKKL
jgi:DNA helicase-2/ATP-dependent DNA helicase PcrA